MGACDRRCGDRQGAEGDHQGDGPRADAADVGQEEEGEEGDEEAGEEEGEEAEEEGQEEKEKEEEEEEGHQVPGRQAAEGRAQEQGVDCCRYKLAAAQKKKGIGLFATKTLPPTSPRSAARTRCPARR